MSAILHWTLIVAGIAATVLTLILVAGYTVFAERRGLALLQN